MQKDIQKNAISQRAGGSEVINTHMPEQPGTIDLFGLFKILLKKIHPLYNIECGAILIYNEELSATTQAYLSTYRFDSGEISSFIYSLPVILNSVQREVASFEYPVLKSRGDWEIDFETNHTLLNGETHYANHCYIPLEVDNKILGTLELHNNVTEFSKECLTFCSNVADLFADAIIRAVKSESQVPFIVERNDNLGTANKDVSPLESLHELHETIASVRTTTDLQYIINRHLTRVPIFRDIIIARPNANREAYSFYLFNSESPKMSDRIFIKMANSDFPVKDGFFDEVFKASGPLIYDLEKLSKKSGAPLHLQLWEQINVKRLVGVPLGCLKETFGVIFLPTPAAYIFDEDQISLVKTICTQICRAMSNIEIHERLLKHRRDKELLRNLSIDLVSAKGRIDLASIIKRSIKQIINFDQIDIQLITGDVRSERFYSRIQDSSWPDNASGSIEVDDLMNVEFFRQLKEADVPIIIDLRDEDSKKVWSPALSYQEGIMEMVAFSLKVNGEFRGWISLYLQKPCFPDSETLELLQGMSSQIAIALSNMLHFERVIVQMEEISGYKRQIESENIYEQEEVVTSGNYAEIVGSGPEMQQVFRLLDQVSNSESTVLILGETGTGKELIARAVHQASERRDKLMIKVNCAAIPPNLIESELFGHEKGSFTGATERRVGKFELANNSTLFLDEIGELTLDLQVKLLRVLQEKEFERVGGKTTLTADVRIISATNRNLLEEVESGRFRRDLYYRLNVFPISLPPLRSRKQDIPLLANYFLERYSRKSGKKLAGFSQKVLKDILNYSWPGNIRELEHLIERQVLLATSPLIKELEFPARTNAAVIDNVVQRVKTIEENERDHIFFVLKLCKGKISGQDGAARLLGVPATTLNSKIKKLRLTKKLTSS